MDECCNDLAPVPCVNVEDVLREEIETLRQIANQLRLEINEQKGRADSWRELCRWAHKTTRDALMMDPRRPRAAAQARDKALSEINARLAGFLR